MAPFSKPETVLKQAEGLVSVGQTHAALQSLTEMFQSKRFRSAPLSSLEPIMIRFIELCVDMRKGRTAKEGLMQYKNIAQNSSVGSIEVVINKFIQLADAKVQEAQEKANKATADIDIDDLEAIETPESILLGAVSGDQSKDRTDRALVTPWLKFLWESYRTALETLKNNARLETIYQQVAQQAFKFCLKHQRKVEFRRLCETLRLHLQNVAKYAHQQHSINLSDQDTLQRHLDTRFAQLGASVELELWQEAFRSVEDVHNLLTMAKKAPRPAMMANYYEKLTRIFLMSGNALYHAAAWGRYHGVVLAMGGRSDEELARLAGQVLVSTLAVPVGGSVAASDDEGKAKGSRLMSLLTLSKAPTRASLLRDALQRGALRLAPQPVRELYTTLEVTFDPLSLCSAVAPLLQTLSADAAYASYLPLLQRALLSRLLSQLSQVYSTLTIDKLLKLTAPIQAGIEGAMPALDDAQVEAYVMGCARRGELGIRVDHAVGSILFVDDAYAIDGGASSSSAVAGPSSTAPREGQVQRSTGELVRTRLQTLAGGLHDALQRIAPPTPVTAEEQQAKLAALVTAAQAERKRLQLHRALVARRRELLQELSARKEKEAASRRAETNRREKEAAERAAREEQRVKALERLENERQKVKNQEALDLARKLKESNILKVNDEEIKGMDTDDLMRLQVEQLEKEKRETAERLRAVAKRIDHLERALRKEERPLLADDYARQQAEDRTTFDAVQKARIEGARAAHVEALETKTRLARMIDDYRARQDVVAARRGEEFMKRREKATKKIEEEKAKRRAVVLKEREEERLRAEEAERKRREREEEAQRREEERLAEEERQRAEEAAKKEAEEEEQRKKEEAAAAARKQREEERAAAAEAARRQQQREEEALARRAEKRTSAAAPPSRAAPTPVRAGGEESGGTWRRGGPPAAPPPRTDSPGPGRPAPGASAGGAAGGVYRPGAGLPKPAGGGWRERMAAREAGGGSADAPPSPASPAAPLRSETPKPATPPAPAAEKQESGDGFQTVEKKPQVWRPSRGRGRGL